VIGIQDVSVLEGAKAIVEDVRHGDRWPIDPEACHNAASATTAFEDAAVLLSFRAGNRDEFDRALRSLTAAIDDLLKRNMPASRDMDHVLNFFAGVGRRRLDESQSILMATSTQVWPEPVTVLRQGPGENG
jgi:hypothetical protein